MATAQPELSELYNKDKYKVVTQRSEDKEGEIRCRRSVPVVAYIEKLKSSIESLDEIVIMGAGKAVQTALKIADIARNVKGGLHQITTRGKEEHSFTFAKVGNEEEKITKEREVEYIRIRIVKDSKVTADDKKSEGYVAPPETVTEESLSEAIKSARLALSSNRRPNQNGRRPNGPRRNTPKDAAAVPAAEGEAKPARRPNNRRRAPRKDGAPAAEGDAAIPSTGNQNRRRGPRRNNNNKPKTEGIPATETA